MTKAIALLTRDASGNKRLEKLLNIPSACFDCFEVRYLGRQVLPASCNIIITSRHAAAYAAQLELNETVKFYVVGTETAKLIQAAHDSAEIYVFETAAKLVEALRGKAGAYTYFRGEYVSLNIKDELATLNVEEQIIYYIQANEAEIAKLQNFTREFNGALIVPLLSKRMAKNISEFFHGISPQLYAVAISEAVAESLPAEMWQEIHIATQPNLGEVAKACVKLYDSITTHYE